MAKQAISATIDQANVSFLDQLAKQQSLPRSEVLDSMIREQYKQWLIKEFQEGYASQGPEDVAMAEEGMEDYLKIIERYEK